MNGGTQETQGTTVSKPYPGVKPLLDKGFKDALKAYEGGYGSRIYTGSTVVPDSLQSQAGYGGIMDVANRNDGGRGSLNNNLQRIIGNGGFNGYQSNALQGLQGQLGRLGNNGLTGAQDDALKNYQSLAGSSYDPNANPGAQGVLDAAIRDATDSVNLNASAAGRYGSGTHEGVLGKTIGDLSSNFRYNDFNNWLGRRDTANQNMASLGQQGFSNIQTGQGNLFNAAQAGLGNLNTAYQGLKSPYQDMLGVGAHNEDLYKRTMDDKLRIFNSQNQQPWDQISRLLAAASGAGQYATNNTTTTAPGPNPFLQTLGGISSGVGILGGLGFL